MNFRRLTDEDLPLLHRWLNEPGVVRGWEGDDVSWEAVVRDYGSAARGSGYGSAMIRAFVPLALGLHGEWTQLGASPLAGNMASWRALEKAGFTFAGTFTDKLGPCRVMIVDRRALTPAATT